MVIMNPSMKYFTLKGRNRIDRNMEIPTPNPFRYEVR